MMAEVTKLEIEEYVTHLINERKLKKTSINKIIFALKSLYKDRTVIQRFLYNLANFILDKLTYSIAHWLVQKFCSFM
jgi:site-specific recombinase XerD